jgi:hypothetical protein
MNYVLRQSDRIDAGYLNAIELGAPDPAVLVIDPRDPSARAILETSVSPEEIDSILAGAKATGAEPILTWGIPRDLAVALVGMEFPEVAATVEAEDGPEGYLAVVVAEGSASAIWRPSIESRGVGSVPVA